MEEKSFGQKLRDIRIQSGKSIPEVSAYLVSRGKKASEKTIYGWERGHSQPSPDTLLALCEFYDVSDILAAFGYREAPPVSVSSGELSETETLFMSLPAELRQEALRYMRYLAAQQDRP